MTGRSRVPRFVAFLGAAALILVLNLIFLITGALAQDTVTGAFQGDVSNDRTGDPIAGVIVSITNVQTGVVYNLTTDAKGRFYQGLLAPGAFDISVTVKGFKPRLLRREIKVSLTGDIVPVPVSLEPETVPTGQSAALEQPDDIRVEINTTDARRDGSNKKEEIGQIPLGSGGFTLSFDELALLQPGVVPPPQTIGDVAGPGVGPGVGSAGQFSVNGMRSRANNFTVDGSDNNDEDIGVRRQGFVALIPQPLESIQEFQIITLLAPAQFGRNIGAQVNAVSRAGGNKMNGSIYGTFNSGQLNARNFFDTTNGNAASQLRTASGQSVLLDGQPLTVRNQSGGEDSFTYAQGGGTLGGAIIPKKMFYFISAEFQKVNAMQEKSFAVPTIEQRGAFGTGTTGIYQNFLNPNQRCGPIAAPQDCRSIPNNESTAAVFSLFPFPNNINGIYGANNFTQALPASGRGAILSGRIDKNFSVRQRPQSLTARYNFTDDRKFIPAVGEAIFSTIESKIRTQNLSLFFNSQISDTLANQIRFSIGKTRLTFYEVRDHEFLIPSAALPNVPFLLNSRFRFNTTLPAPRPAGGCPGFPGLTTAYCPNTGPVNFVSSFAGVSNAETFAGPLGQVSMAGFSTLGVDVYNFPQTRRNSTYQLADELTVAVPGHRRVFGFDGRRTGLDSDLPRLSRPLITFNGTPRLISENGVLRFPNAADANPIIRPEDLASMGAASNFMLTFNVDRPDAKANLRFYQSNFYGQDTWHVSPRMSVTFGLRYEYNTPVSETSGLIERSVGDPRQNLPSVSGLKSFVGGRTSLYRPDRNNLAPRVGVAVSSDRFGKNRLSVFRAGYGIFYDQILGAVVNQSRNVFPTYLTVDFGGLNRSNPFLNYSNPAGTSFAGLPLRQPGTINTFNRAIDFAAFLQRLNSDFPNAITATLPSQKLEMPMAHQYSFAFEQQLSSSLLISAAYVGTAGRHLLRFTTPNLGSSLTISPTTLASDLDPVLPFPVIQGVVRIPARPIANVGAVDQFETTASSHYNSLQTGLRGRLRTGVNFQIYYTLSKVLDDVSDVFDLAGASVLPQNSLTFAGERGPANFDRRHAFVYSFVYELPMHNTGNRFRRLFTDNLRIAGDGQILSGQPFTVNSIVDVNLDGNLTDRLDTTTGIETTGKSREPLRLRTTNTLALLAPFGQDGRIGRNSFRAGGLVNLNLSVTKRFIFGSKALNFRTELFNFINRTNFGVPVRLLEASGFGKATGTITPGRRVQFALKYEF